MYVCRVILDIVMKQFNLRYLPLFTPQLSPNTYMSVHFDCFLDLRALRRSDFSLI